MFSERVLPMQVHLQIVEALQSVVTNDLSFAYLMDFDKSKIKSLVDYCE